VLAKRIIPCLDFCAGRTVKGARFVDLRDAGDPADLAERYACEGADEIAMLDISATKDERSTSLETVRAVARHIDVPLTVGGGVSTLDDMERLFDAGADKIAINTAAVQAPEFITAAARAYGSQCIVVAIDAQRCDGRWLVKTRSASTATQLDAVEWARAVVALGAGEILLTSIDRDGTKLGYDVELTRSVADAVAIPLIASGGAAGLESFAAVFKEGRADAALAASVFHYDEFSIGEVKRYLHQQGIEVRL